MTKGELITSKDAKISTGILLFTLLVFFLLLWSAFAVVPLEFPANNTNASAFYGLGPNGNSPSMAFFNGTNGRFQCNVSVVNGSTVANITRVVLFINQTTAQLDNNSAIINLTHTINSTFVSATINFTVTTSFNDGQYAWMCQQEDNNSLKIINQSGTNFFTIDTTAPQLVQGSLTNNSATGDSYRTGQSAHLTLNVSDTYTLTHAVRLFVNVSGQTSNEVNITRNVANNISFNLSYAITFASSQILNFTFEANDTLNNRRNLSTSLVFSVINTIPDANTSFNVSSPTIGTVFNFSGNVTDDVALHTAQWIHNVSGSFAYINITLSGTSASVHSNLTFTRGGVFNFTLRVNDTVGNVKNNITIVSVTDNLAPIVNTSFNRTSSTFFINDVINFTANITDETSLSTVNISNNISGAVAHSIVSLSGTSAQVSNITTLLGVVGGSVINFSMVVTDTAGNRKLNFTIVTVTDNIPPVVNTTFNATTFRNVDVVNYTANITDETGLSAAQWITNVSGSYVYINVTISGTTAQVSNFTSLYGLPGGYTVNFTILANDTSGNRRQNTTIITVTDVIAPIVNTTFNSSAPAIGTVFNFTGNVTDDTALSLAQWIHNASDGTYTYINITLSGTSASVHSNLTFTRGGVFNFTLRVNDTRNNIQNNITIVTVTDNVAPIVNTTFNITQVNNGHVLNFTANITDETSLQSVNISNNMSGTVVHSVVSLSGTSAKVSNLTTISVAKGSVINFSMVVRDTSGNARTNSTVITVVDTIAPTITMSIPSASGNHTVNTLTPTINVSSDASTCIYEVNQSGTNVSMTLSSGVCTGTSTMFKNGNHNLTFVANDTTGNVARLVFFLNMSDTTPPVSPNGTYASVSSITTLSATLTLSGINESVNATVYRGTSATSITTFADQKTSFATSHTLSLTELSASTTYYLNITICDYAGNCISNSSVSFTTSANPTTSSGSSGGGGGAAPAPAPTNTAATASKVWGAIQPDTPVTMSINNEKIAISSITLSSGEALSNAELAVDSLKDKPSSISSAPVGVVYQYVDITPKNLGTSLEGITIEFDVPISWLTSNGIDRDTVVLYRYANNQWNPLPTSVVNIKIDEIEYSATTPGFSTFAIGSTTQAPAEPTEVPSVPETTPIETTETPAQPVTEQQISEPQPEGMELKQFVAEKWVPLAAIAAVLVAIIAIVIIRRNKGEKE
jgi:PGF-pre-PGF domain-containing protein